VRDRRPAQLTQRSDLRTRSPALVAGLFSCLLAHFLPVSRIRIVVALKAKPEYDDKKILCGITNVYLKPAGCSQI